MKSIKPVECKVLQNWGVQGVCHAHGITKICKTQKLPPFSLPSIVQTMLSGLSSPELLFFNREALLTQGL